MLVTSSARLWLLATPPFRHWSDADLFALHFPHLPASRNTLLTDIVLPLYIRWLQQHLSPAHTERPAAIVAPTKRHARTISRNVWQYPTLSRSEKSDFPFLVKTASHRLFSFNTFRGSTCHYALIIHTDRLRTRHRADRYSLLYRAIAPAIFRGNDSALIIVGDSRRHPRLSFARQSAAPPYPLHDSPDGDHIIILSVPDLCPIPPPPQPTPIMPFIYPIPIPSRTIL